MKKNAFNTLSTLLFICLLTNVSSAQKITEGLSIGVKLGTSRFLTEVATDFSGHINEFNNNLGPAYDFELTKRIGKHLTVGAEIGVSQLKGYTNTPNFSAIGNHVGLPTPLHGPVEYNNKLRTHKFILNYFLHNMKDKRRIIKLNPFVRLGLGNMNYDTRLRYKKSAGGAQILKEKEINTMVWSIGAGFNYALSEKMFVVASSNINTVNYDRLDVVKNYDNQGNRMDLYGLFADFKVGIFYRFGKTRQDFKIKWKMNSKPKPIHPFTPKTKNF